MVEAGTGGTHGSIPGKGGGICLAIPCKPRAERSKELGASCRRIDNVDEAKADAQLQIEQPLARWGPTDQCQSFCARTIWNASAADRQAEQDQRLLN